MPLLPYCVVLTKSGDKFPTKGVGGAEVRTKESGALTALYSEMERDQVTSEIFRQAALQFHDVVHGAFHQAAVIPFRFPTWLSEAELARHLEKESNRYRAFLRLHADHVQMELRIEFQGQGLQQPASSGTEHLRRRAAQLHESASAAEELKQLVSPEVVDWRERDLEQGTRLFALVRRRDIAAFRERLSKQSVRCTGPWPATEFFE